MIEPADHQTLHGHTSGEGDREGQRDREDDGECVVRHEELHDIAGVGPHHDELTMRHVDHAHHPKGDGKADGCEEIDGSKRQRVEAQVHGLAERQLGFDVPQGLLSRKGHGDGRAGEDFEEHKAGQGCWDGLFCDKRWGGACGGQGGICISAGGICIQRSNLDARDLRAINIGDERLFQRRRIRDRCRKLF